MQLLLCFQSLNLIYEIKFSEVSVSILLGTGYSNKNKQNNMEALKIRNTSCNVVISDTHELCSHLLSFVLSTRMRKSRTLDSRDMFSRKLFVKLRNRRTLPKDFSQRSLLLLWLSRVWFNKLNIARGGNQLNSLVFSLLHACYESFQQDNAVN